MSRVLGQVQWQATSESLEAVRQGFACIPEDSQSLGIPPVTGISLVLRDLVCLLLVLLYFNFAGLIHCFSVDKGSRSRFHAVWIRSFLRTVAAHGRLSLRRCIGAGIVARSLNQSIPWKSCLVDAHSRNESRTGCRAPVLVAFVSLLPGRLRAKNRGSCIAS